MLAKIDMNNYYSIKV